MNTRHKIIRQGDVALERVQKLPRGLKDVPREQGRVILAHGEVTGHAHAILDPETDLFVDREGNFYLEVRGAKPAKLLHEEHKTAVLEPGVYQVHRQREYQAGEIRRVQD